jgi:hypothetical protein
MEECGLLQELLPELAAFLQAERSKHADGDRVFWQYLDALDELSADKVPLSNALLFGAIGVHLVQVVPGQERDGSEPPGTLVREVDRITREWVERLGMARRDRERLAHMLRSQPRFEKPRGRRFRPRSFVTKHYYPDAQSLFALGCRATGLELETLARWQALFEEAVGSSERPRRKGSRGGRRSPAPEANEDLVAKPKGWGRGARRRRR